MRSVLARIAVVATVLAAIGGTLLQFSDGEAVRADKLGPGKPPMNDPELVFCEVEVVLDPMSGWTKDYQKTILQSFHANLCIGEANLKMSSDDDRKKIAAMPKTAIWSGSSTALFEIPGPLPKKLALYSEDGRMLTALKPEPGPGNWDCGSVSLKLSEVLPCWSYFVIGRTTDHAGNPGPLLQGLRLGAFHNKIGSEYVETARPGYGDPPSPCFATMIILQKDKEEFTFEPCMFQKKSDDIAEVVSYFQKDVAPGLEWRIRHPGVGAHYQKVEPERTKGNVILFPDVWLADHVTTTFRVNWNVPKGRKVRTKSNDVRSFPVNRESYDPVHLMRQVEPQRFSSILSDPEDEYGSTDIRVGVDFGGVPRNLIGSATITKGKVEPSEYTAMLPIGVVTVEAGTVVVLSVGEHWGNCYVTSGRQYLEVQKPVKRQNSPLVLNLEMTLPKTALLAPRIGKEVCDFGDVLGVHELGDTNMEWPGLWCDDPAPSALWDDHGNRAGRDLFPGVFWWYGDKVRVVVSGFRGKDTLMKERFWKVIELSKDGQEVKERLTSCFHQSPKIVVPSGETLTEPYENKKFILGYGGVRFNKPAWVLASPDETEFRVWNENIWEQKNTIALFVEYRLDGFGRPEYKRVTEWAEVPFDGNGKPIVLQPRKEGYAIAEEFYNGDRHLIHTPFRNIENLSVPSKDSLGAVSTIHWDGNRGWLDRRLMNTPSNIIWGGKLIPIKPMPPGESGSIQYADSLMLDVVTVTIPKDLQLTGTLACTWTDRGEYCKSEVSIHGETLIVPAPPGVDLRFFAGKPLELRYHLLHHKVDADHPDRYEITELAPLPTVTLSNRDTANVKMAEQGYTYFTATGCMSGTTFWGTTWYPFLDEKTEPDGFIYEVGGTNTSFVTGYVFRFSSPFFETPHLYVPSISREVGAGEVVEIDANQLAVRATHAPLVESKGESTGTQLLAYLYATRMNYGSFLGVLEQDKKGWKFSMAPNVVLDPSYALTADIFLFERSGIRNFKMHLPSGNVQDAVSTVLLAKDPEKIPDIDLIHSMKKNSWAYTGRLVHVPTEDKKGFDVGILQRDGSILTRIPAQSFEWSKAAGRMVPGAELMKALRVLEFSNSRNW